jgi:hypothetical protein
MEHLCVLQLETALATLVTKSEFIDFHLRPFVENLPSHIKDTTDYLTKMENLAIPENTTLVTMDVTSLFVLP